MNQPELNFIRSAAGLHQLAGWLESMEREPQLRKLPQEPDRSIVAQHHVQKAEVHLHANISDYLWIDSKNANYYH